MFKLYMLILLSLPIFFIILFISRLDFWEPVLGLFIGFLVWLYDYDFLLNAGGPEAPISEALRKLLDAEQWSPSAPLYIFMLIGAGIGGLVYGWHKRTSNNAHINV